MNFKLLSLFLLVFISSCLVSFGTSAGSNLSKYINKTIAKKGGSVAENARKDLEKKLGESIISPLNSIGLEEKAQRKIENNKE